jgi:23S rRNA pseudouridine1911/1915/1917 synthase
MNQRIEIEQIAPAELDQYRLDQALAILCPEYSRGQIQQWIRAGCVQINDQVALKPRAKVQTGQRIVISTALALPEIWQPQDMPLKIIYEDADLIVIDKPAGLIVHPGAGNSQHTLVNALLHYDPQLAAVPRAGLVHRLDKDTSGLLVVARNLVAHHYLVKNLQLRKIQREYAAVAHGVIRGGGVIRTMIGRHPTQRTKMSVVNNGKLAVTHYRVLHNFPAHTYLHIQLETGRTHQIRVHFAHIQHPLVGDQVYGGKKFSGQNTFPRQALHAVRLALAHPKTGEMMSWNSDLPEDIKQLLQQLQGNADAP